MSLLSLTQRWISKTCQYPPDRVDNWVLIATRHISQARRAGRMRVSVWPPGHLVDASRSRGAVVDRPKEEGVSRRMHEHVKRRRDVGSVVKL